MSGRLGVLLVQLGGPEKREELRPFLYELFADPEVIALPAPLRQVVAGLIAFFRAPKSAKTYELIGWSPIRRWTATQARLLEEALAGRADSPVVRPAMTCSEPTVRDALAEMRAAGVTRLVVLPLYPQYSVTTTRSSFAKVDRELAGLRFSPDVVRAPDAWYDEPRFIAAHVARIEAAAATLPDQDPAKTVLLYSAHSLPVATVEKQKDPYPKHVQGTVAAIETALGKRFRSRLAYQSKVGPVPWIGPSTPDVIAELAREKVQQVIVAPIAFVSDHVETLYEIRMLFAGQAKQLGIPHFVAAEGLNDHPDLMNCLAALVERVAPAREAAA